MTTSEAPPPRILRACRRLLGVEAASVEFPGGRSRDAVRVHLADGRRVILARRKEMGRAVREARILEALHARGAPVPRLLAFDGLLLVQEDLGGERLSLAFERAASANDTAAAAQLAGRAIDALAACHRAADDGLAAVLAPLGRDPKWLLGLLDRPRVIGDFFALPAPEPDRERLLDLLAFADEGLVKWDARPGNAVVRADGTVAWFDWEHAGRRRRTDDAAWLLCDEFTPGLGQLEEGVLERCAALAPEGDRQQALDRILVWGVFHSCVRIGLLLANRADGPWWDWRKCLERDRVGVTAEALRRLCRRAARWAERVEATRPLAPWFRELPDAVEAHDRAREEKRAARRARRSRRAVSA